MREISFLAVTFSNQLNFLEKLNMMYVNQIHSINIGGRFMNGVLIFILRFHVK